MKPRLNVYLDYRVLRGVEEVAARHETSKSGVIEAAVRAFLSEAPSEQNQAAMGRRLDRLTRQYARLERMTLVSLETLALFVRHYLSTTAPLAASERAAAVAKGEERFARFTEQLGRELARGGTMVDRVITDHAPMAVESSSTAGVATDANHAPAAGAAGPVPIQEPIADDAETDDV